MALRGVRLILVYGSIMLGIVSPPALADGKSFSIAAKQPTMPDQRAMIVFDGSTETLLIDTTIEGAGGATAWVVPVPAEPEVFEVERGLFPTLQVIMQPRVLDRRELPLSVGLMTMAAAATLLAAALRWHGRPWGCVMAVLLAGFFLALLLLPALGTARGDALSPQARGPDVSVRRTRVGIYETAVLRGIEAGGVAAWLEREGFQLDPGAQAAIAAYDADGWWFVASKLQAQVVEGQTPLAPHPLGLRFAAKEPVYPMRLTGTQNRQLAVDLFVFGPRQVTAGGFSTERCARVRRLAQGGDDEAGWRQPVRPHRFPGEDVAVGHPQLVSLVGQATTATWLRAKLSSEQMRRDVILTGRDTSYTGNTEISVRYAGTRAGTIWTGLLLVGSVTLLALGRPGTSRRFVGLTAAIALGVVPALVAVGAFMLNPGVPIEYRTSRWHNELSHNEISRNLTMRLIDHEDALLASGRRLESNEAERLVRDWLPGVASDAFGHEPGEWQNQILGVPMREAAEPGGYRIWRDDAGLWYGHYDLAGQEMAERIWTVSGPGGG